MLIKGAARGDGASVVTPDEVLRAVPDAAAIAFAAGDLLAGASVKTPMVEVLRVAWPERGEMLEEVT